LARAEALLRSARTYWYDDVQTIWDAAAIFQSSPLERCWRDVHTAAQHLQVQDGRWETAGRVLLGLDPASLLL